MSWLLKRISWLSWTKEKFCLYQDYVAFNLQQMDFGSVILPSSAFQLQNILVSFLLLLLLLDLFKPNKFIWNVRAKWKACILQNNIYMFWSFIRITKPVQEIPHAKNGLVHSAGTVKSFPQQLRDLLHTSISHNHYLVHKVALESNWISIAESFSKELFSWMLL